MSESHATLERQPNDWVLVDQGSKNGSRVGERKLARAPLVDGDLLELGGTFFRFRSTVRTPVMAPADVDASSLSGLVARLATLMPSLIRDLEVLDRVARSDVAILLLGETGTGKEILARALHDASERAGAFVAVNCGAMPAPLVEGMLFGHKRGAFSGAVSTEIGFVRAADGGTLFLDEIGDLQPPAQAALLRVLQEREVLPIGNTVPVRVDVRVVAATHRPLGTLVARESFRHDLYARLSGYTFMLPPLRDRLDDLGLLIASIARARRKERDAPFEIGAPAMRALLRPHPWPNNVRELVHHVAVGRLLGSDHRIKHVPIPDPQLSFKTKWGAQPLPSSDDALRAELVSNLTLYAGNVTRVGQAMGKARTQVQRWLRRFDLDPRRFRGS